MLLKLSSVNCQRGNKPLSPGHHQFYDGRRPQRIPVHQMIVFLTSFLCFFSNFNPYARRGQSPPAEEYKVFLLWHWWPFAGWLAAPLMKIISGGLTWIEFFIADLSEHFDSFDVSSDYSSSIFILLRKRNNLTKLLFIHSIIMNFQNSIHPPTVPKYILVWKKKPVVCF